MNIIYSIELKIEGVHKKLIFGFPVGDEIEDMYKFRYNIYLKHNYINENESKKDIDEYDDGKSVYFIAKIDGRIIGTARLIQDAYLPTEKECFSFKEPIVMSSIPREKRAELGRLIVEKYKDSVYLPRHLVMLGLILSVANFAKSNNIDGGYSFIKITLKNKLDKLHFPYHKIDQYKQIYNGHTLKKYFLDQANKVVPIYFVTDDIIKYMDKVFSKKFFFKKESENSYKFRNSFLYNILSR